MTTAVSPPEPAPDLAAPKVGGPGAVAGRPHAELPRAVAAARRVAAGHHLPGRQAGDGPRRGGPPQHPLPRLPGPDGPGPGRRPAGHRHHRSRSGSSSTSRPSTAKLEPPGRHDACFLPRSSHVTGNIQIHEMAWGAGGELWVVNTRFSCLCTLDRSASFTPRWRPPFVSALEPTDRCHLNGLGMVDGRPRYVTALGETDDAGRLAGEQGQGRHPDGRGLGRGAHPRACRCPTRRAGTRGRLWVCESGAGTLGFVDLNTGKYEPIAEVPGFTRGLDFAGRSRLRRAVAGARDAPSSAASRSPSG